MDKHYTSPLDKMLNQFDQTHPRSHSQTVEYEKYQRIYEQRDHVETSKAPCQKGWKEFLDNRD
ncbi:MAG TPA: CBU_0585 family protein [Coxiellaceae bacterium]|nr:CBU_0585 family protein [Coxiellaceae bacterium]